LRSCAGPRTGLAHLTSCLHGRVSSIALFFSSLNGSSIGLSDTIMSMISHKRFVSIIAFRVQDSALSTARGFKCLRRSISKQAPALGRADACQFDLRKTLAEDLRKALAKDNC
jgi:hypothetical protein